MQDDIWNRDSLHVTQLIPWKQNRGTRENQETSMLSYHPIRAPRGIGRSAGHSSDTIKISKDGVIYMTSVLCFSLCTCKNTFRLLEVRLLGQIINCGKGGLGLNLVADLHATFSTL